MKSLFARWSFAVAVALCLARPSAQAQHWMNVTPPSSPRVTSICHGAGGFVAVGEGVTVFVTTDGETWTTGTLPAFAQLPAVTYSAERNLYVCVSGGGEVFTATNPNGVWTARASGTTSLSRVAAGGGGFVAVAGGGIVSTSADGINWTARSTGRAGSVSDVAFGNGVFVVVGVAPTGEPTLLVSSDGGATFSARAIPGAPTQSWLHRVVFTGDKFYVTGYAYLLASSADGSNWSIEQHPDHSKGRSSGDFSLAALDRRLLVGAPDGTWIRDLAGNESYAGSIPAWTAAAANSAQVLVAGGDLNSQIFRRFTFGAPASLVDATFRPATERPDAVVPLPDGRCYVAADDSFDVAGVRQYGLARLKIDGTIDPEFNIGGALVSREFTNFGADGTKYLVSYAPVIQPDANVVVFAQYRDLGTSSGLIKFSALARFDAQGRRDTAFQPDEPFKSAESMPLLLSDGRWLVATPAIDSSGNRMVRLARFTANGATDPSFGARQLAAPFPAQVPASFAGASAPRLQKLNGTTLTTVDGAGRVYVVTHYGFPPDLYVAGAASGRSLLFRLNPDGTPDPTFTPRTRPQILTMQAAARGLMVEEIGWLMNVSGVGMRGGPIVSTDCTVTTSRLTFDGVADPGFRSEVESFGKTNLQFGSQDNFPSGLNDLPITHNRVAAVLPDGLRLVLTLSRRGHIGIIRFDARGEFDPNFAAELENRSVPYIERLVPLADGRLLAWGAQLNEVGPSRFVRLAPVQDAATSRLANLSVRARASAGAEGLIAGCIVGGGTVNVLVRGIGPALVPFGVADALADPRLDFYSGSTIAATNDNWSDGPAAAIAAAAARAGAFPLPVGSRDAALLAGARGGQTVRVTGESDGIALVELYDTGDRPVSALSPRLKNLSARAVAGAGGERLIAGFIIDGASSRTVLVRAVGPGLVQFGLNGVVDDPLLTVFRGGDAIASNDDAPDPAADTTWNREGTRVAEAANAAGAFALGAKTKDAALVITLPPGAYTAQVTSRATGGIALVEIYDVP